MSERIPVPRKAVERLRELTVIRERADREMIGLLAGLSFALGLDVEQVSGFEDGEEPALLLRSGEPTESSPSS